VNTNKRKVYMTEVKTHWFAETYQAVQWEEKDNYYQATLSELRDLLELSPLRQQPMTQKDISRRAREIQRDGILEYPIELGVYTNEYVRARGVTVHEKASMCSRFLVSGRHRTAAIEQIIRMDRPDFSEQVIGKMIILCHIHKRKDHAEILRLVEKANGSRTAKMAEKGGLHALAKGVDLGSLRGIGEGYRSRNLTLQQAFRHSMTILGRNATFLTVDTAQTIGSRFIGKLAIIDKRRFATLQSDCKNPDKFVRCVELFASALDAVYMDVLKLSGERRDNSFYVNLTKAVLTYWENKYGLT
jgi:hypothetical protein